MMSACEEQPCSFPWEEAYPPDGLIQPSYIIFLMLEQTPLAPVS